MSKELEALYTLTLVGDPGVGKSRLVTCFFYPDRFKEPYFSTLTVTYGAKKLTLDSKLYKVHYDDMPSTGNYVAKLHVQAYDAIIFVFDITNQSSFHNLSSWIEVVNENAWRSKNYKSLLVGNKCDLEREREVERRTAEELADSLNIPYIETSAKEGINVELAFVTMATIIRNGKEIKPQHTDIVDIKERSVIQESKSKCSLQ